METNVKKEEMLRHMAGYIREHRDEILADWRARALSDATMETPDHLSKKEFQDHVPAILKIYEQNLTRAGRAELTEGSGAAMPERQALETHGLSRWQQGFDIAEVVADWNHLRKSLESCLQTGVALHPEWRGEPWEQATEVMAGLIDAGVSRSVARFEALRQSEARGHYHELKESVGMLETIIEQQSVRYRQIVHDLKGNLGILSGVADCLRHSPKAKDLEALYGPLDEGLKASLQILEELKYHTMLESGIAQIQVERFDASPSIRKVLQAFVPVAEAASFDLRWNGPEHLEVECDPDKLERILQNLLSNTFEFTRAGKVHLDWGLSADGKTWGIHLDNQGVLDVPRGTQPITRRLNEAPRFDPFLVESEPDGEQRGQRPEAEGDGKAPDPDGGGLEGRSHGIGLSIAKRLTDLMGGRLTLDIKKEPPCVRIEVVLPVRVERADAARR